jgi:hypothetical protein
METMHAFVERITQEAQLSMRCGCGGCHPTATVYADDLRYEWHEARLAEAPCCCGRFFVVAHDPQTAQTRAETLAKRIQDAGMAPGGHIFRPHGVTVPWGGTVAVVSADLKA